MGPQTPKRGISETKRVIMFILVPILPPPPHIFHSTTSIYNSFKHPQLLFTLQLGLKSAKIGPLPTKKITKWVKKNISERI